MKAYTGVAAHALPDPKAPDFTARLRDMIATIDVWARDASFGFGRIERGEVPSGGGGTLGVTDHGALTGLDDDDHAQYLLLAGRSGQSITDYVDITSSDSAQIPLTLTGGSNSAIAIQKWENSNAARTLGVKIDTTPQARIYTNSGTPLQLRVNDTTSGLDLSTSGAQFFGNKVNIAGSASVYLFGVDAAAAAGTVADSDDNIRIIRRSATQTGMALRLMEQSRTTTLASITPEGYFDTPRLRLMDATGDLLSIVPAAATTAHTLTMPAANLNGLLENNGTGTLSWVGDATAPASTIHINGSVVLSYDSGTGFGGEVYVENGTPTQYNTYNLPTSTPAGVSTIVVDNTSTQFALILSTGSRLISNSASSGVSFSDTTTSTKRLRAVLSGAVGNNSFTLTNSAARNYGFGNLSGNVVVVGDDPPTVASGNLGKVDLTAQTANIATTNLSSTPPAGLYAVEVYLLCTTADVTAGTLAVTIGWTDGVGATTSTPVAAFSLATTGRASGRQLVQVASGDITYAVAVTGGYGTSQYAVYVRVIALG